MAKIEYFANTHNNVNFLQEATTTKCIHIPWNLPVKSSSLKRTCA